MHGLPPQPQVTMTGYRLLTAGYYFQWTLSSFRLLLRCCLRRLRTAECICETRDSDRAIQQFRNPLLTCGKTSDFGSLSRRSFRL